MPKSSAKKVRLLVLYFLMTVVIAAVLEIAVLLIGRWLRVRVPVGVTVGLLLGPIAFCAGKVHQAFNEH